MMKSKLLEALSNHRRKIESLFSELAALPPEAIVRKPADGGWSAMQTVQHLIMAEASSLAYVQKKMSFNPTFEEPGMGASLRYALLYMSMISPLKFKAPKVLGDDQALPNHFSLDEARAQWHKSLDAWADFFAALPDDLAGKAVYKHPRAGRISFLQMLHFFGLHFDRHLKQIRRAARA